MKISLQHGMTIFEILLVLVIASGILMLSLNQYRSLRLGADAEKLKNTINDIALAASYYYRANCKPTKTATTAETSPFWTLLPVTQQQSFAIDIKTQLENAGYLRPQPLNPLVYQTGNDPYEGFYMHFISSPVDRTVCTSGSSGSCTSTQVVGTILNWQIYMSVCLRDPKKAAFLKGVTNAVLVDTGCTSGTKLGFVFSPTQVIQETAKHAAMMPLIEQFTQMYTTMPITYLTGTAGAADDQYYYCGS